MCLLKYTVFTECLVVHPVVQTLMGREPHVTSLRGRVMVLVFINIWQNEFQSPQMCLWKGLIVQFPGELGAWERPGFNFQLSSAHLVKASLSPGAGPVLLCAVAHTGSMSRPAKPWEGRLLQGPRGPGARKMQALFNCLPAMTHINICWQEEVSGIKAVWQGGDRAVGRGGGRQCVIAKLEGWPVASTLSLTACVTALHIQGRWCL